MGVGRRFRVVPGCGPPPLVDGSDTRLARTISGEKSTPETTPARTVWGDSRQGRSTAETYFQNLVLGVQFQQCDVGFNDLAVNPIPEAAKHQRAEPSVWPAKL